MTRSTFRCGRVVVTFVQYDYEVPSNDPYVAFAPMGDPLVTITVDDLTLELPRGVHVLSAKLLSAEDEAALIKLHSLLRCPFVRLVAHGRDDDARVLAAKPPDPVFGPVADWLITEARRQLQDPQPNKENQHA